MSERRRVFHLGLWGPRVEEGVEWEIEHHIEERIDELIALGRTRIEAEEEARRSFGDLARVRREMRRIDRQKERRMRLQDVLETVWQDVRYGLRGLVRDSTFTMSLILTMGLGIGANVSMFSVLDALLLRPLPYHAPSELYQLMAANPKEEYGRPYFEWPFARAFSTESKVLEHVLVHSRGSTLYTGGAEAMRLSAEAVTSEFEETLGVQPVRGRGFLPEDTRLGAERVVLIDYAFWQSALGGADNVIGSSIELDGQRHRVIGVMPQSFKFPEYSTTQVWAPLREDGTMLGSSERNIFVLARVPSSQLPSTRARLTSEGGSVLRQITANDERVLRLEPLNASRAGGENLRRSIWLLSGAVLFILLVAGVNAVNLLLVRGIGRAREIAVRLAIGALRGRLVRQLITETFTLTLLSVLVAVLFALVSLRAIQGIVPDSVTFFAPYTIGIERRALLFTLLLTMVAGVVLGAAPALLATRRTKNSTEDLTRYATRTPARSRLRRALVTVEVALSVTLLVGAGLFIRSFVKLQSVNPGFEPKRLAILRFEVSRVQHPDAPARVAYLRRLTEAIEAIPGVQAATVSNGLPPHTAISFGLQLQVEGEKARSTGNPLMLPNASVQPNFFAVTGARLLTGRAFAENEPIDNVIIDQDMARYLWPNGAAVGHRFRMDNESPWLTVVGVMADLKLIGPDDRNGKFEMVRPIGPRGPGSYVTLGIRTRGDESALLQDIRRAVHTVDARQPIEDLAPATVMYGDSIALPRFLLVLISVLAGLALLLAAVGIYGVLAFGVSLRAHEMGVRSALGARAADLIRMVVREGMTLAIVGALLGAFAAFLLSRFIKALLFAIEPLDPATFVAVFLTIVAAALIAAMQPARRAARTNPVVVLRSE